MSKKTMIDYDEPVHEPIEIKGADEIGVITNVTFPKGNNSICIEVTYWDSKHNKLDKTNVTYDHIFTHRKDLFQKMCEDFELINNGILDLNGLIGSYCVVRENVIYGVTLEGITDENMEYFPDFDEAAEHLQDIDSPESIENIPVQLANYWYNPCIDYSDIRRNVWHGIITKIEFREKTKKIIITVTIFAGGRPISFDHYINSFTDPEIDKLMGLFGAENYFDELLYQPVDTKLFKTTPDRFYSGPILRPRFKSSEEERQVSRLINDYIRFCKMNEDNAFDYNER